MPPAKKQKSNTLISCSLWGLWNGGFDPSRVDGAIINALKYDLPQGLHDAGDAASLVGYRMTITGVGAGGAVLSGLKILAQIMKGVQDVMGAISIGGAAGDSLESWFGGDKVRKHTFTSYRVSNPNRPCTFYLIKNLLELWK